jgi:hypothetical protein
MSFGPSANHHFRARWLHGCRALLLLGWYGDCASPYRSSSARRTVNPLTIRPIPAAPAVGIFLLQGGEAMGTPLKWITIESLFDGGERPNLGKHPWEIIENAQVVIGRDIANQNEFLVYGRKRLEDMIGAGGHGKVRIVGVELNQETNQLEELIAVVQTVKGSHDYRSGSSTAVRLPHSENEPIPVAAAEGVYDSATEA